LAARLSATETDALILHELAHYARGDYWVRLLELVAHVAYWWHPIVWWARREIESAEEQCCDGWVVERQRGTPLSYAEAILTTIDFLCEPSTALPPAACGLGDVPLLRSRLTCIMRGQLGGQLSRGMWVAVLGSGIVLSPVAPAVFATSSRERVDSARPLPVNRLVGRTVSAADVLLPLVPAVDASSASAAPEPVPAASNAPVEEMRPVSAIFATARSPNGRYTLEARTIDHEVTLRHDELPQGRLYLNSNRITCAAFSPDSAWFVTGHADGALRLWDSHKGSTEQRFQSHSGPVASIAFSPDGTRFAAGASDGTLSVWDLAGRQEVASLKSLGTAVSCLRWSPSGDRLAVALGSYLSVSGATLIVWSPDDGAIQSEEPLAAPVGALDWISNEALVLADWQGQGTLHRLDGSRADEPYELKDPAGILSPKDLTSAAQWSPNCRLLTAWERDQFLLGAAQ
jgi:hypothetical protein